MKISKLMDFLKTLPDDMDVFVQTCEEDYLSTLETKNMKITKAFIEQKRGCLEASKLVITAFTAGSQ